MAGLMIVAGVAAIALTVYWVLLAERATRAMERASAALERVAATLEQGGWPPGSFPHPRQ